MAKNTQKASPTNFFNDISSVVTPTKKQEETVTQQVNQEAQDSGHDKEIDMESVPPVDSETNEPMKNNNTVPENTQETQNTPQKLGRPGQPAANIKVHKMSLNLPQEEYETLDLLSRLYRSNKTECIIQLIRNARKEHDEILKKHDEVLKMLEHLNS